MKIHYVHTTPLDAEEANLIQVLHMAKAFSDLGHELVLSLPAHRTQESAEDIVKRKLGTNSVPFQVKIFRSWTLAGHLKSTGCIPGVVQSVRSTPSDILFVRVGFLLPFLIRHHDNIIYESHNNRLGPQWLWKEFLISKIVRLSQKPQIRLFVTISKALESWWKEKGVPSDKLVALHDGVDFEAFAINVDRFKARKKLNLLTNGKLVVYTGSLYKDRGVERIVRLAEDFPEVHFVVVGGPENRKLELENLVKGKGLSNIVFMGYRPQKDIPMYLASADVLLMLWSKHVPTINYCSPLKLFEYLAAGRIIVGDRFPTIMEVVKDRVHGFMVDPESYENLKQTLKEALSGKNLEMIEHQASKLAQAYSWKERCIQILNESKRKEARVSIYHEHAK